MIAKYKKEILKKEHSKNHWHGIHSNLGKVNTVMCSPIQCRESQQQNWRANQEFLS